MMPVFRAVCQSSGGWELDINEKVSVTPIWPGNLCDMWTDPDRSGKLQIILKLILLNIYHLHSENY